MKTGVTILILIFSVAVTVTAQDGFTLKKDSLRSEILNQNRKLDIYLPEGYEAGDTRFPVIYVLDGEGRDQHVVPTARFLLLSGKMPKAIIVGVINIDRNHDFLPDSSEMARTGGGADNFIRFVEEELFPYVEKNFRTEPYKVLIGHSYGGLFAIHALLNEPDLFDAYLAIDPSIWYNDKMILKNAEKEFPKSKNWNKSIFITGRDGAGMNEMGITSLENFLKTSAPAELNWKIMAYTDEDHGSVTFKSAYDGLRFIFDAGANVMVYPMTGRIPDGDSIYIHIGNINPSLRYTTDGSEPAISSPLCTEQIRIAGPCRITVKSVAKKYKNAPSSTYIFTKGEFLKGRKSVENLKSGLKYSLYEGVWDSLPDFSKLSPVTKGITDNIDLKFAAKKDSVAIQYEGYLHISKKGIYDMWILSDDGSEVYLNNELILDNDGLHSADMPRMAAVPLNQGYYPVIIRYFNKTGGGAITVGASTDKKTLTPEPLGKEMLFYKE